MIGILIISHSDYASSIIRTSRMLAGEHDFVDSVGLEEGCDPEAFGQMVLTKVSEMKSKGYHDILIMADLFGGTPCNQALQKTVIDGATVVAGVNLPMVLQAVVSNNEEMTSKKMSDIVVEVGKEAVLNASEKILGLMKGDE